VSSTEDIPAFVPRASRRDMSRPSDGRRSLFADAESLERVRRAPTLANAGYPFVRHGDGGRRRHAHHQQSSQSARARTTTTTTTGGGKRASSGQRRRHDGDESDGSRGGGVEGGRETSKPRAYVRVEDVIESTRAAEDALKRSADDARAENERERVKRYAKAQLEAEESARALEAMKVENRGLSEENARLAVELRSALSRAVKASPAKEAADDEEVDETVRELFDLVEKERRARRELEEKLGEYEHTGTDASASDARPESKETLRQIEEAETTIREQETKLSQAADIIGELRTALLQVMETEAGAPESTTTNSQVDGEGPSGGTPLERTTAAVRMWETKVERLVMETVTSALQRAMDSPALQTNAREGEQVVSSVTDAINHELSAIVENAMSGIVDEMRFQFGQDGDEKDVDTEGRKRFIVWLADENMRRAQLEEQLSNVQDELARSEASRQVATQRWLQAMSQIEGSMIDDESDLGEIMSRLDDASDDGASVHSFDVGELGSPNRRRTMMNRRAMSVIGDAPIRQTHPRDRIAGPKSETHEYANLHDVSLGPNARLRSFPEEEEDDGEKDDDDDEAIAALAIEATPGGSVYYALRTVARTIIALACHVARCARAVAAYCSASANFELVWPVALLLACFYWKIGIFTEPTIARRITATSAAATAAAARASARVAAAAVSSPPPPPSPSPILRIID